MQPYYARDFHGGGRVTIYHADCRDVLPTLDAVDHVITDPPYSRDVYVRLSSPNTNAGSGTPNVPLYRPNTHTGQSVPSARLAALAAGTIGHVDDLAPVIVRDLARLVRRWALVFSDVEFCDTWRSLLTDAGLRYVRTGAWVKPDAMPQMSGDRPSVGFEPCTICHAPKAMRWNGGGKPALWTYGIARGADRPDHPCPKPLPLMQHLIADFTDVGDVVLDPFMGSGTTLVAAAMLGRSAVGIECEERWCAVAAGRLAQDILPLAAAAPEPAQTSWLTGEGAA